MRKVRIKLFIILLFLIVLINCNAQVKYSVVYRIDPLKNGETLDFKQVIIDDEPNYTTIIYKVNDRKREEIKKIKNVICWPKLLSNSTKLIYLVDDENDKNGKNYAYILDGKKGSTYLIGKISCAYDISDNGGYLCYTINSKIRGNYAIPGIVWKDLETGKTREYDFSNTFLKNEWGAGVYIRYITEKEIFSFRFSIEDIIFSTGYITVTGGDYKEYTDVIGRGYVKSKNAKLWQNPSIHGNMVMIDTDTPWSPISGCREVDILEKSKDKVRIGNHNDYWYKVRTFFMYEGWIYGAYITLEK